MFVFYIYKIYFFQNFKFFLNFIDLILFKLRYICKNVNLQNLFKNNYFYIIYVGLYIIVNDYTERNYLHCI